MEHFLALHTSELIYPANVSLTNVDITYVISLLTRKPRNILIFGIPCFVKDKVINIV